MEIWSIDFEIPEDTCSFLSLSKVNQTVWFFFKAEDKHEETKQHRAAAANTTRSEKL